MERNFDRKIVLEDGAEFYGRGFGCRCDRVCEIVFNTSMAGYQELIYDPSNLSLLVVMTYPIIGNLGITDGDQDAKAPFIGALAVRQLSDADSSYASTISDVFEENGIPGISELDTRQLTRHIRGRGRVFALITDAGTDSSEAVEKIRSRAEIACPAAAVSTHMKRYFRTSTRKYSVVVIDCGVKLSYIRLLNKYGCNVTVMPWDTRAEDIMGMKPDGVFVSSGPGSPESARAVADTVSRLRGKLPVFGMGLGCALIALACGAVCIELPTAHRGCNHPIRCLTDSSIETQNQNHAYTIDIESLENTGLELTHVDIIDGSAEAIADTRDRLYGTLYYPESVVESAVTDKMLGRFLNAMKEAKENA